MTEAEFVNFLGRAKELLSALRDFPARDFENEARRRSPEEKEIGAMIWAAHLEAIPDPQPLPIGSITSR